MKKISIIFAVLSILMTMTQCKKDLQVIPTTNDDVVYISVKVANAGSKVDVNTANGIVTFEKGDVLYVVSNGKCVGNLENNGDSFTGSIEGAVEKEPLYFYFLGNKESKIAKGSTSCSVLIDDQTEELPVISYGRSNKVFEGVGSYSVFLLNQCALMKFDVKTESKEPICLIGMNNKVEIDFEKQEFRYKKDGEGIIKLHAGEGERWAIVFPQDELRAGESGSLFSEDVKYTGVRPALPKIEINDFFEEGTVLDVNNTYINDGAFTASRAKRVTFSGGNLQYVREDDGKCIWKIADNQYDIIGEGQEGNSSSDISRDLFGWGTGNNPSNVSTNNDNYNEFVDWGSMINKIDGKETWRTLSGTEWDYIINRRSASTVNGVANARYTRAQVCGVNGMILFPDVYTHPADVAQPKSINYTTNNNGATWTDNTYDKDNWSKMEEAGAIFLPAAGSRKGTDVNKVGEDGRYWSCCCVECNTACNFFFSDYRPYPNDHADRCSGFSVRLVHE